MSLVRLKDLVDTHVAQEPHRTATKFEVYDGEDFVCDGSYRHWKSNEVRDFRYYSHQAMQLGYEITTWQETDKPTVR